jgi:predicted Zn-dependent peptidase/LysM repeat protein
LAGAAQAAPEVVHLSNGLRVVLLADRQAPVLSLCTSFDAGVRRDADSPGVARVAAELLRNGGRPLEGQDVSALLTRRGGTSELTFDHDAATFCTTVPAAELEFALWFEAGRFGNYALTPEGRDRVVEELTREFERLDDLPATERAPRRLRALAFQGRAPYARATLPTSAQLEDIELERVRAFHREHYGASAAAVALVGDFDPAGVRVLLERYFGTAPRGTAPAPVELEMPHQTTERFSMVEDATAKVPAAWYGWVLPPLGDKQRDALELAAVALASEKRLGGALVGPRRLAESLEASLSSERGPQLFALHAVGTGPAALEGIQKALDAELAKIAQFGLSAEERAAAEAKLRHEQVVELASNLGRAKALGRAVLAGAPPEGVLSRAAGNEPDREVSNVELARTVREYLQSRRRTVIEIYPKGWSDPWQTPMPVYHLVSVGENLGRIAAMHDTTIDVLAKMNQLDPKKPIYPGQSLKVPRSKATSVKAVVHTVRAGDTLTAIARKFNVTVQSLAEANGIDPKRPIRAGDELRVPSAQSTSSSSGKSSGGASLRTHSVRSGETLGGIAKKYGVATAQLAAANGLGNKTTIRIGQVLTIPAPAAGGPAGPSKAGDAPGPGKASPVQHTVRAGETLSGIAHKYGVSVDALARANRMDPKKPIRVGQHLVIPR